MHQVTIHQNKGKGKATGSKLQPRKLSPEWILKELKSKSSASKENT
jgi:hypothetical protein